MSETVGVTVELIGFEKTPRHGTLIALITAEVTFSGGEVLRLQGMQIRKTGPAEVQLLPPQYRGTDGRWTDAVVLDSAIMISVLDQIPREWFEGAIASAAHPQALDYAPKVASR